MSKITVYWNSVIAAGDVNLKTLANISSIDQSAIGADTDIAEGCRGIYFRSVLSDELNINAFLSEIKLEDVRKARNEPDNTLLYRPKCKDEKSIGVLRIVRPKRFGEVSGVRVTLSDATVDSRNKQFEVLLESTEFILEEVQEQMAERYQLQETFGDFSIFFFGKRAEIFRYSGSLLNAQGNLQWRNQFLHQYENYLRGSKCAELKARAYLLYDDVIREGFILSAAVQQSSSVDGVVKFTFELLVTNKKILGDIPTTRTGLITLNSDVSKVEGGVTDFQFIRASDPQLPGVGDDGDDFFFEALDQPGGEDIPADLEQLLRKQSIAAIESVGGDIRYSQEDTVIEQDVLINFIHMGDLKNVAKSTAKLISGDNSGDSANVSGDVLATELISGSKTVDSLTLKEAISAAEAMSRNRAAEIGRAADNLQVISTLLGGSQRIVTPPATIGLKEATSYSELGSVILSSANDQVKLTDLIESAKPIKSLNDNITKATADVVASASGRILLLAENEEDLGKAQAAIGFIAAFCLIPKASGGQFISDIQLPNATTLNGLQNSLEFVKSQKISKLTAVMAPGGLPDTASTELQSAVAALRNTSLMKLLSSKVQFQIDGITFGEGALAFAKSYDDGAYPGIALSDSAYRFLTGTLTYVTAMLAEKAAASKRTSVDWYGATVLPSESEIFQKYFDRSYADDLMDSANTSKASEYVLFGGAVPIITTPSGKYLQLPFATLSEGTLTVRVGDPGGKDAGDLFTPAGGTNPDMISVEPPVNFHDQLVQKFGYVKITNEQFTQILAYKEKPAILFRGTNRQMKIKSAGSYTVSAGVINFGLFTVKSKRFVVPPSPYENTAHGLYASPLGQSYFSARYESDKAIFCTIGNLLSVFSSVKSIVVGSFASVVTKASQLLQSIVDQGKIPESEAQKSVIKDELAMKRFGPGGEADIALVTAALPKMEGFGVKTENFIEFSKMVAIEAQLSTVLNDLHDELGKAVASAQSPDGKKAAEVSSSDVSVRKTRCGERETTLVGPDRTGEVDTA